MAVSFPNDWVTSKLEDVVEILDSLRVPVNNSERQLRIEGKSDTELYPYYGATGEVGKIDGYIFDEELVALGEDGVPFFDHLKTKAYLLRGKTWVNNHAHVLKGWPNGFSNNLLLHYLNQFDYHDYVNGGTRLKLTQANMRKMPMPLPPLAEQKVIADKLDTLLAQVDNTKARLERIPEILKSFRQSVLAAAVSGKLTKGWVSHYPDYYVEIDQEISRDPKLKKLDTLSAEEINQARTLFDNPAWDNWKLYPLELLVEAKRGVPYGIVQTGEARLDGIRTIRCGDVKPLAVDTRELKLVSHEIEAQYARTRLQGNEVILAIRGTVGNAAVITRDMVKQPLNISREVAMIPVRNNINPHFISFLLQSPGGYRCLAEKTKGVAQQGINLADVKRLVTPLPPLDEQTEIVRRVEELFAYADRIEQAAQAALSRVNNLTQSILAKAFRGELTADWRAANLELISGDNSAEALLAKIKAERATFGKARLKK